MTNDVKRWTDLLDWIDSFGEVEVDEDFRAATCIALAAAQWEEASRTRFVGPFVFGDSLVKILRGEGPDGKDSCDGD
jgi:hypothetical protein